MKLNTRQKKTMIALCDAFIPSIQKERDEYGYWNHKASDFGLEDVVANYLDRLDKKNKKEFLRLLDLLGAVHCGWTWLGIWKPFYKLTEEQQTKLLRKWAESHIPDLRKAFNALKRIIGLLYYSLSIKGENLHEKALDYGGVIQATKDEVYEASVLPVKRWTDEKLIQCDVLVVGSGAGGGVVAAELAAAGHHVVVMEKGDYFPESRMTGEEGKMLQALYEDGTSTSSTNGSVAVLAGACIGGGTTVNWSASLRTPDFILQEWASEHDNPHFAKASYQKYFEKVEKRTHINTTYSIHNPQNQAIIDGAKALGYSHRTLARNVAPPNDNISKDKYWKIQGYGGLGDSFGYKQGTMKTYLKDATENRARIYANAKVHSITHAQGQVTGAEVIIKDKDGTEHRCNVRCKKVVVCAGAIHTPAILKRSGLQHPHLGKHLYLHPVNAVSGTYSHKMESWYGPMMSAVCDEFTQLDGNYGYLIETPPAHLGFAAASTPWVSGSQYKEDMFHAAHKGTFIVLTRDKFGGEIKLRKNGQPKIHYKINPYDKKHLIHGMKESVKIHHAAGAKNIRLLHNNFYEWKKERDNVDNFIQKMEHISWATNRFIMFSAHQMGTCRMGGRAVDHPLKPNGETREIKNLFVADASAFPKCSGVNPMLSIQALAHYIAEQIVAN